MGTAMSLGAELVKVKQPCAVCIWHFEAHMHPGLVSGVLYIETDLPQGQERKATTRLGAGHVPAKVAGQCFPYLLLHILPLSCMRYEFLFPLLFCCLFTRTQVPHFASQIHEPSLLSVLRKAVIHLAAHLVS